ncbi:hypothetical protein OJAV_G00002830 [Oryzias javanicus]|uniref:Uncharacterized protein n=1 Tax=Oryzias javanicus TaxID=123683 RepID=A0A437DLB8_ORYJA|nr:hypothetical protein OJAV_G00002830 [Oryzias javanicus]
MFSVAAVHNPDCQRISLNQMGQALWRLSPRQQQQLQEELADQLAERGGGKREQGRDGGAQRRAAQHCYSPDIYHCESLQ